MHCDDFAEELTSRALAADTSTEPSVAGPNALDLHLSQCAPCRAELGQMRELGAAQATAARANRARPSDAPPREVLFRVLATVRDEAAQRRTDAAEVAAATSAPRPTSQTTTAASSVCERFQEDVPAAALRSTTTAETESLVEHLAACAPCADEAQFVTRLIAAQRQAHADRAADAPAPRVLAGLLAAVRAEPRAAAVAADVSERRQTLANPTAEPTSEPSRDARPIRSRPRWWRIAFPLAAAAAVTAAILTSPDMTGGARICCDSDVVFRAAAPNGTSGDLAAGGGNGTRGGRKALHVGRERGAFPFATGDEFEAGAVPAVVKLSLVDAPSAGDHPTDDEVLLTLAPGAVLARVADSAVDLRRGRLTIEAGSLTAPFEVRHGDLYAAVRGTEFDVDVLPSSEGDRLLIAVRSGVVQIGRRPSGTAPSSTASPTRTLSAGGLGIVGPGCIAAVEPRSTQGDPRAAWDALVAPVLELKLPQGALAAGAPLVLEATISAKEGVPVTIPGFDASEPRLLVRLTGADGRVREVTVQRAMIDGGGADGSPMRLEPGRARSFTLRIDGLELNDASAGDTRWTVQLRYQALARGSAQSSAPQTTTPQLDWLGSVESDAVPLVASSPHRNQVPEDPAPPR